MTEESKLIHYLFLDLTLAEWGAVSVLTTAFLFLVHVSLSGASGGSVHIPYLFWAGCGSF